MISGFKTLIYPDEKQEKLLFHYCHVAHDMYNFLVDKYKDKLPTVNKMGIKGYTTEDLMRDFGVSIPQRIVLGVIKTYAIAVDRFWHKLSKPPRFHKYNPNKQSFYLASCTRSFGRNYFPMPVLLGQQLDLSKKIQVNMQVIRKMDIQKVTEPRITYQNGRWYLSGTFSIPEVEKREGLEFIGLDWGLKNFMTTSNGEFINYPPSVLREFQRISKLQHYMDKKVRGSNNWRKAYQKFANAYERFNNLKKNFIEQTTTTLCKNNNIVVEDLTGIHVRRNSKNMRRTRRIAPRYEFTRKLAWKADKFGTTFMMVNPAYTSRTCSCCGLVKEKLTLADRVFICDGCGLIMDRDVNAAKNLVAMAICCSREAYQISNSYQE